MSLSPNFTAAQDAVYPNIVILADTSTGSDSDITSRKVYITDDEGNFVVPDGTTTDYIVWPYSDTTISLNILQYDMALSIRVDWLNDAGEVLYSLANQFCFALFNKQFYYQLVEQQGLTPRIVQDTVYFFNVATFWSLVTGAINAVEVNNDITASQECLDAATNMRENQDTYF